MCTDPVHSFTSQENERIEPLVRADTPFKRLRLLFETAPRDVWPAAAGDCFLKYHEITTLRPAFHLHP